MDDVPTAVADTHASVIMEGASDTGTVLTNDIFGADGKEAAGGVTGVKAGTDTSAPVTVGVGTGITGTYGTLTLQANGTYSYKAHANQTIPVGAKVG